MVENSKRDIVENALGKGNGILRLKPAWVARDFLPPGRRLGLKEDEYNVGERGFISRTLDRLHDQGGQSRSARRTKGLSYLGIDGERITLKEAVEVAGRPDHGRRVRQDAQGTGPPGQDLRLRRRASPTTSTR